MSQYLDTRDLEERREELQAIKDAHVDWEDAEPDSDDAEAYAEWEDSEPADLNEAETEELEELNTLEREISEWLSGETLIPEDAFPDYVEELCTDCGYIPKDFPWWISIDWEATADNVKQDYTEVTYLGETYLVRS